MFSRGMKLIERLQTNHPSSNSKLNCSVVWYPLQYAMDAFLCKDRLALMNELIDKAANALIRKRDEYIKTGLEFWPFPLVSKTIEFWKNGTMKVEERDGVPVIFSVLEDHEEIFEKYHDAIKDPLKSGNVSLFAVDRVTLLEFISYLGIDVINDKELMRSFDHGCWYAAFKMGSVCHPNPLTYHGGLKLMASHLYQECATEELVDAFAYFSLIYSGGSKYLGSTLSHVIYATYSKYAYSTCPDKRVNKKIYNTKDPWSWKSDFVTGKLAFRLQPKHGNLVYKYCVTGDYYCGHLLLFAGEEYDPDKHLVGPCKLKHNGVIYNHYQVLQ